MVSRARARVYARRRARRMAGRDHDLTDVQWQLLQDLWQGCAYCGTTGSLQRDCLLPIANGGRYTLTNVVPACRSCNASKGPWEVTAWLRRTHRDEAGFLSRHVAILATFSDPELS